LLFKKYFGKRTKDVKKGLSAVSGRTSFTERFLELYLVLVNRRRYRKKARGGLHGRLAHSRAPTRLADAFAVRIHHKKSRRLSEERLAYMLQDARPACVLTSTRIAELLSSQAAQFLFDHPDTETRLSAQPAGNPTDVQRIEPLPPQHPAYVIYTSGSTGTPKGVAVTQGAIVNRTLWMQSAYQLKSDDRVLQKTSSGFDVGPGVFLALNARRYVGGREARRT